MSPAVVLVGAPGSGKSTVGALLAERLGQPFVDVDAVIAERAGKTIAELFTTDGEAVFRELERAATVELLDTPGVVSLGGGAVTSTEIRAALAGHRVVWLQVSAAAASQRIGMNEARPLLLGNVRGQLVRLLAQRAALYAEVATVTVDTDGREPAAVAESVLAALGSSQTGRPTAADPEGEKS